MTSFTGAPRTSERRHGRSGRRARQLLAIAMAIGVGALASTVFRGSVNQAHALDALTAPSLTLSVKLEQNGFYRVEGEHPMRVAEWLPDMTPGAFPLEFGADKPTVYFSVDGEFTTDWSRVRNGITVRPGDVIRNANQFRVVMQGVREVAAE